MNNHDYEIALKYEPAFRDAFVEMCKAFINDTIAREFEARWNRVTSIGSLLEVIPFFRKDTTDETWIWLSNALSKAYLDVIDASGTDAARKLNRQFGTQYVFSMIEKASNRQRDLFRDQVVMPVNPYAIKWMRTRSLKLIKESFSDEQRAVVKKILTENFRTGTRLEVVLRALRDNIGLTFREYQAVANYRDTLYQTKLPLEHIDESVDKYRDGLLKKRAIRIARTETVAAQAEGRNEAWKLAQESGVLPEVERVWVSFPKVSPRLCEICADLNGKTAPIGEEYESGISMPPDPHPQCRCTEILRPVQ